MDSLTFDAVRSRVPPIAAELAVGGLFVALVCLAPFVLDFWPFYAALSGPAAYSVAAILLWRLWRQERPASAPFGWANRVTGFRMIWVLSLIPMILAPGFARDALLLILVGSLLALALDGVDGWLARRTGTISRFGARFDMETDALFMLLLAVLLVDIERAGPWVLALGLMRYAFVAAGKVWHWLEHPLPESLRRKAVCVVQVVALIVALAPFWPAAWAPPLLLSALVLLTLSFAVDVVWLARHRRDAV